MIRLGKLLNHKQPCKRYRTIINKLEKREPYIILECLQLLSIDNLEFKHLKKCLYQNELGVLESGGKGDGEIHEEKAYWRLAELDLERP